jgi:hypothetical protein
VIEPTTAHTVRLKSCCGIAAGARCECLTSAGAAAEWAALGRQRPPIRIRTGAAIPDEPATKHPASVLLVNRGGLLRRPDSPALSEEQS